MNFKFKHYHQVFYNISNFIFHSSYFPTIV